MARLKNRVICLGFIEKGTGKHMSNSCYSRFGISPCVMASLGVKQPATIGRSLNGMFLGIDEMYLKDIDKKIANAVCARYYKGLEADNSNAVLVEFYE